MPDDRSIGKPDPRSDAVLRIRRWGGFTPKDARGKVRSRMPGQGLRVLPDRGFGAAVRTGVSGRPHSRGHDAPARVEHLMDKTT